MEVRFDDFWINGVSARSIGLTTVDPLVPPPMAARRYNTYQIGSDTDMTVADDEFDNIPYSIKARVIGKPESLDNSAIYAFLAGAKTLKLSRLPLYEFRIQKIGGIQPVARAKGNEIVYNIGFELSPWKYLAHEPEITLTTGANVQNAGTRYCKPIYTLSLSDSSGSGTLTVNGQSVSISIPQSIGSTTFVIDAEKMLAYSIGTENVKTIRTNLTSGIYPFMSVGNNYVQFSGIIQSVSIKRNERCY